MRERTRTATGIPNAPSRPAFDRRETVPQAGNRAPSVEFPIQRSPENPVDVGVLTALTRELTRR